MLVRLLAKERIGQQQQAYNDDLANGQAAAQIRRRCGGSSNPNACGIVAVDVSKLLNPGSGHLFDAPTSDELSLTAEQKVTSYGQYHRRTLQSVNERCVLGVYVHGRLPGAVRQPVGLWMVRKTIFIILHLPTSQSGRLAFEFLNRITSAIDRW
jgi:hypothetical protein